jgi:uncharacterized protein YdeI (YjbR/CyaY-like superfamily)
MKPKPKKPTSKSGAKITAKAFQATLERGRSRLNWVIIRMPFDVQAEWGKRGQLKVKGDINGFAFRTSLFPTGQGDHVLLVNKRMQAGARASVGTVARFRIEPDTEERTIAVPAELEDALAEDRALRRFFNQLNPSARADIAKWVGEVKSAETRVRRAEQMAERLLAVIEAEHELPPILRVALARDPQALEGWNQMSLLHRRRHFFGIFGYRNPEARARRVAKALQEAREIAEKRTGRRASGS